MKEIYVSCEGGNNGQISGPPRRNGLKRTRPTPYASLCGLHYWQHGALYSSGHDQYRCNLYRNLLCAPLGGITS